MKITFKILLLALISIILLESCRDIFEKDISKNTISIVSPPDNYTTQNYQIIFLWNESKDIQKYRLQIVSPSFDSVQRFILDTLTTDLRIAVTLFPGKYQWRIRGENNSSYSIYQTRRLLIDTTTNLNNQAFAVNSPQDNYYTKSNMLAFSWLLFPYATSYEYNLLDSFGVIQKIKTTSGTAIYDTIPEGTYKWRVRALNTSNGTATQFSIFRSLVVDQTAPTASIPSLPVNKDSLSNNIKLTWIQQSGTYADSIFVTTDSTFQNILYRENVITGNNITLPPLTANTIYYWRTRSIDRAGNLSGYSISFSFFVNP